MRVIMLGSPGAGKGTQGKRIAEEFKIPHVSTGDIFRANIKQGTKLGALAKEYMDKGLLVPDDVTIGMLIERIHEDDCKSGYVLDGFPRTITQADKLDEVLNSTNENINYVLNIDVPDEVIIKRMSGRRACLSCGQIYHIENMPSKIENICDKCGGETVMRDDDKPETVIKRLNIYHEQTKPLIDYYEKKKILKTIDGTQSMEKVFMDILEVIKER